MKSIVIISDLHCGSVHGLTPPEYQQDSRLKTQSESWNSYKKMTEDWHAPDVLLVNGDATEGAQSKQGGAELITTDTNVQCDMAVESINLWGAKKILMSYGSPYHVGEKAEDFEYQIAKRINATIEGRLYFEMEGLTFDARHKVGTSSIPHGRATPLLKEMMWDMIREAQDVGPNVNIIVRSHAHYYMYVELEPNRIMIITPALQLSRGRFGSRMCQGTTHWGAIRLIIDEGKIIQRDTKLWKLLSNKPQVLKIE